MHARWWMPGPGQGGSIEELQRPGEIQVGIGGDQARDGVIFHRLGHQDGGGPGVLHLERVLRVRQEGELARTGVLHAGHPGDLDLSVSQQFAVQPGGDVAQSHSHRVQ